MKTTLFLTLFFSVTASARPDSQDGWGHAAALPAINIHCTDKSGADTAIGIALPRTGVQPELAGWFPYEITFSLLGCEAGAKVYADFSGPTSPLKFSKSYDEEVAISGGTALETPNHVFGVKLGSCTLTHQ